MQYYGKRSALERINPYVSPPLAAPLFMDVGHNADGDLVITTGDGKGYMTRYTFSA